MTDLNYWLKDENLIYRILKIISFSLMAISIAIFIYFLILSNFLIHFLIAIGCFLFLFSGLLVLLRAYLIKSEKSTDLTFERTRQQIKSIGWFSLVTFYFSGLSFTAGLFFIAQNGDVWRHSIILFSFSLISLITSFYGLLQRRITKQHYELQRHQQEIIELLHEMRRKELKDITGGVLLA